MTPRAEQIVVDVVLSLLFVAAAVLGVRYYGHEKFDEGYDAAVAAREKVDAEAVLKRTRENTAVAARQDGTNAHITKEKDDEIAELRRRLAAAPRLRVGPSVCPDRPAAPAQAESPAGGDGADPSAGLVSAAADRDLKQLIEDVEQDLATGRACQAFVRENGLVP